MAWIGLRSNGGKRNQPVKPKVVAAIMGALAMYLEEFPGDWQITSVEPVAASDAPPIWALAGRRDHMASRRYATIGRRRG